MTFRVGQNIECINNEGWPHLEKGRVYICTGGLSELGDRWVCVNCCAAHDRPPSGWHASRFRIVERKTDISVLTALLTPSRENADA